MNRHWMPIPNASSKAESGLQSTAFQPSRTTAPTASPARKPAATFRGPMITSNTWHSPIASLIRRTKSIPGARSTSTKTCGSPKRATIAS
jgi:hypothetical protein